MNIFLFLLFAGMALFAFYTTRLKPSERGNFFTRFERGVRHEVTEREDRRTDPPNEDFDTQTIEDWRRVRYRQTRISDYLLGLRDKERMLPEERERYRADLEKEEYKRRLLSSVDPADYDNFEDWRENIIYFGKKKPTPAEEANLRRRWVEGRKEGRKR